MIQIAILETITVYEIVKKFILLFL